MGLPTPATKTRTSTTPGPVLVGEVTIQLVTLPQATPAVGKEPNITCVLPGVILKPVPVMVTASPPASAPEVSDRPVTVGGLGNAGTRQRCPCSDGSTGITRAATGSSATYRSPLVAKASPDGVPYGV